MEISENNCVVHAGLWQEAVMVAVGWDRHREDSVHLSDNTC